MLSKGSTVLSVITLISLFLCIDLLLVLSIGAMLLFANEPEGLTLPLGMTSSYLSAFICGIVAVLRTKELTVSLISGPVISLVLFLISALIPKNDPLAVGTSVICHISLALTPAVSSIITNMLLRTRPRRKRSSRGRI